MSSVWKSVKLDFSLVKSYWKTICFNNGAACCLWGSQPLFDDGDTSQEQGNQGAQEEEKQVERLLTVPPVPVYQSSSSIIQLRSFRAVS
ncbi:MAG: hypothetical protein K2G51_04835 [Lachnospiraceae bacterium]|nr:hypothetical protein [Lachnospiraceae bacterium]